MNLIPFFQYWFRSPILIGTRLSLRSTGYNIQVSGFILIGIVSILIGSRCILLLLDGIASQQI